MSKVIVANGNATYNILRSFFMSYCMQSNKEFNEEEFDNFYQQWMMDELVAEFQG